jgi:hypothetical protein
MCVARTTHRARAALRAPGVQNARNRPRSADLWDISAWQALICGLLAAIVGFRAFCTTLWSFGERAEPEPYIRIVTQPR